MKNIKMLLVLLVGLVFLEGCVPTAEVNACDNDNIKIGLVSDSGGVNDKSFNQGTWEGIQAYCSTTGIGAKYIESQSETDYEPNIKTMSEEEGIEAVVVAGYTLANATYEVAKDHPDVKYIIIDSEPLDKNEQPQQLDNVISYLFSEQEAGYLVGYIAGEMTQTNKVGFIGGMEIPSVQKFGWGYVQGVAAANPDVEVYYQYSGSFDDQTKGSQISDTMYSSGVDIIFACAGGVNDGVLSTAKTRANNGEAVWVIGVDRDMYEDGKYNDTDSVILTSAVKRVDTAVQEGLGIIFGDDFKAGTNVLGSEEGGVGLPEVNPNIEEESIIQKAEDSLAKTKVKDTLKGTKKAIGDLKVNGNL